MIRVRLSLSCSLWLLLASSLGGCDEPSDGGSSRDGASSGDTGSSGDGGSSGNTTGANGDAPCDAYEAHIAGCLGDAQGEVLRQECDNSYEAFEVHGAQCRDALDAFYLCLATRSCDAITELEPCVDEDRQVKAACG